MPNSLVKFARGFGVVLRHREHPRCAASQAAIDAVEEWKRELAGGTGNFEERQEDRRFRQQFAKRFLAARQISSRKSGACCPAVSVWFSLAEAINLV